MKYTAVSTVDSKKDRGMSEIAFGRNKTPTSLTIYFWCTLLFIATCANSATPENRALSFKMEAFQIDHARFCGTRGIVFTVCRKQGKCGIALLDRDKGAVDFFAPPPGKMWILARPTNARCEEAMFVQEDTMDQSRVVGKIEFIKHSVELIREISGLVSHPTLVNNGSKILFAQALQNASDRPSRQTGFDWYVYDRASQTQIRLTNRRFFDVTPPAMLAGGGGFLFATSGSLVQSLEEKRSYDRTFKSNDLTEVRNDGSVFRPYLQFGDHSSSPSLAVDGKKLLFVARTNGLDQIQGNFNYDLFLKEGSEITRLTNLRTFVWWSDLSPDGREALALVDQQRSKEKRLIFINVSGQQVQAWSQDATLRIHYIKGRQP